MKKAGKRFLVMIFLVLSFVALMSLWEIIWMPKVEVNQLPSSKIELHIEQSGAMVAGISESNG